MKLKMVRIFFSLPLAWSLILFPHVILAYNARILSAAPTPAPTGTDSDAPESATTGAPEKAGAPESPDGGEAVIEIPNMHQIGAPMSQQNKPNFAAKAPAAAAAAAGPAGGGAKVNNPLIDEACAVTQNKQLCSDSLKAEPLSASADLKSLAFISLNVTKNEANKISEWLYEQLDDPNLGAGIQQAYTDCAEQYTDAVAQVEDSMLAFFANAYNDIEVWMNTAVGNAGTCGEALKSGNAMQTMGDRNDKFKQQCANSLAIISSLMKKKQ